MRPAADVSGGSEIPATVGHSVKMLVSETLGC